MTVKQLHTKLDKEIKEGNGHHLVYLWVWDEEGCHSIGIKNFVHCSDAVILEPKVKLSVTKSYLVKIKKSFDEYHEQLKEMFRI